MRTQDQQRAEHAYAGVEKVPKDQQSKFKTLALKFPAMVLQCGLLQTMAFYQKSDAKGVFGILEDWLKKKGTLGQVGEGGLVKQICRAELSTYRLAGREALAYGTWLKRAAEVLLKDVKEE